MGNVFTSAAVTVTKHNIVARCRMLLLVHLSTALFAYFINTTFHFYALSIA